jgi:hypothetical protein
MRNEPRTIGDAEKTIGSLRLALEGLLAEHGKRGGVEYGMLPRHRQPREIVAAMDALEEVAAYLGEAPVTDTLGRFDHHPDPAIDFCVEVETLEGEWFNTTVGFANGTPSVANLRKRVDRAMDFRVGGDLNAIGAKTTLRRIEAAMNAGVPANV